MTIASFCRDQLLAHGPLPLPVLAERAAQAGVTRAQDPVAAVRDALTYKEVLLADGRWATPLWLLEGRILTTHGLPHLDGWSHSDDDQWPLPFPGEVVHDGRHDLALIDAALRSGPLPLASGGSLRGSGCTRVWRAPQGWPDVRPGRGELLGLRVRAGRLHVEVVPLTRRLRAAGEQLALEVGRLDPTGYGWWGADDRVSEQLTARLWNQMAVDATLLTAPVPPLSRCIPPLAFAIRSEQVRRAEEASRWRPQLDLPPGALEVAVQAAGSSGQLLDAWLSAFVCRSLQALTEHHPYGAVDDAPDRESYADVVPLREAARATASGRTLPAR